MTIAPIVSNVRIVPKTKIVSATMAVTKEPIAGIVFAATIAPPAPNVSIVPIVKIAEIVETAPGVNIAMNARMPVTVNIASIVENVTGVTIVRNAVNVANVRTATIVTIATNVKTALMAIVSLKGKAMSKHMKFKRLFVLIVRALAYADTENLTRTQF